MESTDNEEYTSSSQRRRANSVSNDSTDIEGKYE